LRQSPACAIPAASAAGGISLVNRLEQSAFVTGVRPTNQHPFAALESNYDPAKFLRPSPLSPHSMFFKPVPPASGGPTYDEYIASTIELEKPGK
jgi:hypothetical protein